MLPKSFDLPAPFGAASDEMNWSPSQDDSTSFDDPQLQQNLSILSHFNIIEYCPTLTFIN
jgi:hypothetical protein